MLKILISGASGHVGKKIAEQCKNNENIEVLCGVDRFNYGADFPIYANFGEVETAPDVIVDFSNPSLLDGILEFAVKNKTACVLATTGYSNEQIAKIKKTAEIIPIFFTAVICTVIISVSEYRYSKRHSINCLLYVFSTLYCIS